MCASGDLSCHDYIEANCAILPAARVAELDEVDRKLRLAAAHAGNSHHLAKGAAKRADGRIVGRCSL